MPPKKRAPTKTSKSKTTAKKPPEPVVKKDVARTGITCEQGSHSGPLVSSGRKRGADSPERDVASINKKAKVAVAGEIAEDASDSGKDSVTDEESWSLLSDEDFDKLFKLKEKLSSHVPTTMRYIFKGINYEKAVPGGASLNELIDLLRDELKRRILSGKEIAYELEVIDDVDNKWHDGEYDDELDEDDDGFPKEVRKRLNDAERMLQFMAGGALKSIMRQLNPYARGAGTNKGMASMIIATLENLAQDGGDIKREYMIVKSFGMGCGDDSDPDLNFDFEGYGDDD